MWCEKGGVRCEVCGVRCELTDEKDNVHPGSHPLSSSKQAEIASWLAGVLALDCRKGFTSASMHHFS